MDLKWELEDRIKLMSNNNVFEVIVYTMSGS